MRVCICRGSKEIGGSCAELEADGGHLLIDLELPLDAGFDEPHRLPEVSGLESDDPTLAGARARRLLRLYRRPRGSDI
jgi:ribonuclease J